MAMQSKNLRLASSHKARNWQAILYEDSAEKNWSEILDELFVTWVASPIHDKDINDDGTPKKPHYHVYLLFDNAYTYNYAKSIFDQIGAVFPDLAAKVIIKNLPACIKYLTHKNKPDKAQYNESDIIHSEDFVLTKYEEQPTIEELKKRDREIWYEILDYIAQNDITELSELIYYARWNNDEWSDYIRNKTIAIAYHINSVRNKKEKAESEDNRPKHK